MILNYEIFVMCMLYFLYHILIIPLNITLCILMNLLDDIGRSYSIVEGYSHYYDDNYKK